MGNGKKKTMVFQTIKYKHENREVRIALRAIFGIGPHFSNQICDIIGISNQRVQDLSPQQIDKISALITTNYFFGHELQKIIQTDIKRLKDIRSFRGTQS